MPGPGLHALGAFWHECLCPLFLYILSRYFASQWNLLHLCFHISSFTFSWRLFKMVSCTSSWSKAYQTCVGIVQEPEQEKKQRRLSKVAASWPAGGVRVCVLGWGLEGRGQRTGQVVGGGWVGCFFHYEGKHHSEVASCNCEWWVLFSKTQLFTNK